MQVNYLSVSKAVHCWKTFELCMGFSFLYKLNVLEFSSVFSESFSCFNNYYSIQIVAFFLFVCLLVFDKQQTIQNNNNWPKEKLMESDQATQPSWDFPIRLSLCVALLYTFSRTQLLREFSVLIVLQLLKKFGADVVLKKWN